MPSTSSCLQKKIDPLKQQIDVAKINVSTCYNRIFDSFGSIIGIQSCVILNFASIWSICCCSNVVWVNKLIGFMHLIPK